MPPRRTTPYSTTTTLVTGHFHEGPDYHVWRPRGTNDWLLVLTVDGQGLFSYPEGGLIVEPGDLVLLRPGTAHDYGTGASLKRWELLWSHFHPRSHWHAWLGWPEIAPGLMRLRSSDKRVASQITEALAEAHRLATGARPRREMFALNALERLLLWVELVNPSADHKPLDSRVQRAMDYLCERMAEKLTFNDVARAVHLSPSRLAHLFREQAGLTPQQFLERERLERAKQLLELTPHTVQAIAWQVGYENPFYFTRRFKKHMGLSPRQYRQRKLLEAS
ncbi:MAG: arabinose operon transcriptional regulator AraC [Deinococcota bacterium]|jgi:AraC family transcriptional regulator of arabinose operon|nr:arabinose operon transcriptional regulator AraC [Deinococcota bacterium]